MAGNKSKGTGAGRKGRAAGAGGGVNFAAMSPAQIVSYAGQNGVTDVGQFNKAQRSALRAAVKKGKLAKYPSIWGDNRTFGPPLPG